MYKAKAMDLTMFLLRVVAGFLFIEYGGAKLFGWFGGIPVGFGGLMGAAGMIEMVAGAAMVLGLWVRPIAFIAAGEMAFAYFMGHALQGAWYAPVINEGTPSVLFCFIFLLFAAHGAGKWSLGKNR